MMDDLLERIHGCLVGLAIGDAWGMPGQASPEGTRELHGKITAFLEPPADDPIHGGLKAGQVTDDTLAALAIVRSIIRTGHVVVEDVARSLVEWIDEVNGLNLSYVGPSTKRAIIQLKEGVPPEESGRWGWSNGAAMRIAPVGFLYPGEIEATVEAVTKVSLPTHGTNTAISGAAAVACAVTQCAISGSTITDVVEAAKRGADLGEKRGHPYPCPSISRRITFALELVSADKGIEERQRDLYDLIGTGLASYEVVPTAIALFALAQGEPMEAITLTANTGGDCDTLAAIAGAIAGAFKGVSAFPPQHIRFVEQVNDLDLKKIATDYLSAIEALHSEPKPGTPV